MPVPIMLAITMEDAVTNPIVRRGDRDITRRGSATVGIFRSTILKLSGLANSFEAALESIIGERVFCHSERSEESLIICFGGVRKQYSKMFALLNMTHAIAQVSHVIP